MIFDAYGTLVELDDFYHRLQRGFAERHIELPFEVVQRAAHHEMRHYMANAIHVNDQQSWLNLRRHCAQILADALRAQNYDLPLSLDEILEILSAALVFHAFPEVHKTLETLRAQGVCMGVLSNWDYQLPSILQSVQLDTFFQFIVTSAEAGVEKPDPQFFACGLQKACAIVPHLTARDCFYIGDHYEKDVLAARTAGLTPLWLVRDERDLASGDTHDAHDDVLRLQSLRDLLAVPALKAVAKNEA